MLEGEQCASLASLVLELSTVFGFSSKQLKFVELMSTGMNLIEYIF